MPSRPYPSVGSEHAKKPIVGVALRPPSDEVPWVLSQLNLRSSSTDGPRHG